MESLGKFVKRHLMAGRYGVQLGLMGLVLSLLAACGGGGGGGGSSSAGFSTVSVSGSLGQIRDAEATLLDSDLIVIEGPVELDANGRARFDRPSGSGPFIIEINGDADATYFDESTGTFLPFPAGQRLRAIIGSAQREVGVTLFTELAVTQLENESGGLPSATVSRVNAVNESIRATFLDGLEDITSPPTIVSSTSNNLGEELDDMYAAMLAAYAELASGETAPALAILEQLREDMTDGVFDSRVGLNPLLMEVVDLSDLSASLDVVFASVVSNYGGTDLDISDLQVIRDGQLNGFWNVFIGGTARIPGEDPVDFPLEILESNIPANEVPSFRNEDFDDVEEDVAAAFIEGFTSELPGSNLRSFDFDIRTETLSRVLVDFSGGIDIPSQFIDGFFVPATTLFFDFNLIFERIE